MSATETKELSTRNQLRGSVANVGVGSVMAEVEIEVGGQEFVAALTNEAQRRAARPLAGGQRRRAREGDGRHAGQVATSAPPPAAGNQGNSPTAGGERAIGRNCAPARLEEDGEPIIVAT
jgi:TOBE domain